MNTLFHYHFLPVLEYPILETLFSFSELLILMLYYTGIQFPNIFYDNPPPTGNSDHSNEIDLFQPSEMGIQLYNMLLLALFLVFFDFWCKCCATLPYLLLCLHLGRTLTLLPWILSFLFPFVECEVLWSQFLRYDYPITFENNTINDW